MKCSVCDYDMADERGIDTCGIEIALLGANAARARVEKEFGRFKFKICYVCFLKALGVKRDKSHRPPKQ